MAREWARRTLNTNSYTATQSGTFSMTLSLKGGEGVRTSSNSCVNSGLFTRPWDNRVHRDNSIRVPGTEQVACMLRSSYRACRLLDRISIQTTNYCAGLVKSPTFQSNVLFKQTIKWEVCVLIAAMNSIPKLPFTWAVSAAQTGPVSTSILKGK